jgi:CheY-like chemotaxis protein
MEPRVRVVDPQSTFSTSSNASSQAAGNALRVLVVDDNADAAFSLQLLIRRKGSVVEVAQDGPDALRIANAFEPRVVLLDLGLPDMDGCAVARAMRQTPWGREAVLIAVTGWGEDTDRERCRQAGFDRHLLKPIDPPVLLGLLATIADGEAKAARG